MLAFDTSGMILEEVIKQMVEWWFKQCGDDGDDGDDDDDGDGGGGAVLSNNQWYSNS